MKKIPFNQIVIAIDTIVIALFTFAAVESKTPISGILFLILLIIASAIVLINYTCLEENFPKIKPNEFTRDGVEIMKEVVKQYEEAWTGMDGLCVELNRTAMKKGFTRKDFPLLFPFLNYENAVRYGNSKNKTGMGYWWDFKETYPRIKFLKKMIKWQEEL